MSSADSLAELDGVALFSALRAVPEEERPDLTAKVHSKKLASWRTQRSFHETMAEHLVDDVHPMFRRGFARVIEQSQSAVDVKEFQSMNSMLRQHHGIEDTYWFPSLKQRHPEIAPEVDILERDHHALISLEARIVRGDREALLEFTSRLMDHLNREEMLTVPFLMDGTGGL